MRSPSYGALLLATIIISLLSTSEVAAVPDKSTYTRPLLFAPEDNQIFLTSPQLKWDLENDRLDFGGISLDAKAIKIIAAPSSEKTSFNIGFAWPSHIASEGTLELRAQGKAFWQAPITRDAIDRWKSDLAEDQTLKALSGTSYGLLERDLDDIEGLNKQRLIQLCFVSKKNSSEWLQVCSAAIQVKIGTNGALEFTPSSLAKEPKVTVGGEDLGTRGLANFPGVKPVNFRASFANGATFSYSLMIPRLTMLDVVWKADQKTGKELLVFTGQGAKPLGQVKVLVVPPNHFWSETGLGEEVIWQTVIPKNSPLLRVIAPFNIPFTYIVQFNDLPDETDRLFISNRTGAGTYSSTPRIFGHIPSQAKVSSKEKNVVKRNPTEFEWRFAAPKKGDRNKARVSIFKMEDGKEKEWVAHYQLYRGYPFQFATRLTGIATEKFGTAIVGETALTYFPEDLLLDSYVLDYHRWGFSGRYFKSITPLKVEEEIGSNTAIEIDPLETINVDARYNLKPGLWNRDQLFGPMLSYSNVKLLNYKGSFLGVGAFWARSMPKIFDDLFNIVPFLRYPKYVDVEFIYYGMSLDAAVQAGGTYFLNFQGRVFWSKRFFGEAGFGIKNFAFTPTTEDLTPLDFGFGYGTAGLGLTF